MLRRRDVFGFFLLGVAFYQSLQSLGRPTLQVRWYLQQGERAMSGEEEFGEGPRPVAAVHAQHGHQQRRVSMLAAHDRMPRPVVFDLDGDGVDEIIAAVHDPAVMVLQATGGSDGGISSHPDRAQDKSGQYEAPRVLRKATLLGAGSRVATGRMPVALAVGRLEVGDSAGEGQRGENNIRIVVVLQSWTIVCYDSRLQKLWETTATHIEAELGLGRLVHNQISIGMSDTSLRDGDAGTIVVAGSMALPDGADVEATTARYAASSMRLQEDRSSKGMTPEEEKRHQQHLDNYYTRVRRAEAMRVFAFDAQTGARRWEKILGHLSDEDNTEPEDRAEAHHVYKISRDALRRSGSDGIADWRNFRTGLLSLLPHAWVERDDTRVRFVHLKRDHRGKRRSHWTGGEAAERSHHIPAHRALADKISSSVLGRFLPEAYHTNSDVHRARAAAASAATGILRGKPPNVVVVHTHEGIEVLHLFSGTTVCRMPLPEPRAGGSSVFVDVNGDRVVDSLQAIPGVEMEDIEEDIGENTQDATDGSEAAGGGGDHHHSAHRARHRRGHRRRPSHFQLPSCSTQVVSGVPAVERLWNASLCAGEDLLSHLDQARRSGDGTMTRSEDDTVLVAPPVVFPTLSKSRAHSAVIPFDSIFAVSTGMVSCFNSAGYRKWHTLTTSTWRELAWPSITVASVRARARAAGARAQTLSSSSGEGQFVLVMGGETANLLSAATGTVWSQLQLPGSPVGKPAIGDFDGDGLTDLVFITPHALVGLSLVHTETSRAMFIVTIFIVIALGILAASHATGMLDDYDYDTVSGSRHGIAAGRSTKQRVPWWRRRKRALD